MRYLIACVCFVTIFAIGLDAKCGGGGGNGRVNRREARRMARNMDYGMSYGGYSMMGYGNGCSGAAMMSYGCGGGTVTRTVTVYQSMPAVRLYAAPACETHPVPSQLPAQAPPVQKK